MKTKNQKPLLVKFSEAQRNNPLHVGFFLCYNGYMSETYDYEKVHIRGDDKEFLANFLQESADGTITPVDLSGAEVIFTVKKDYDDEDADAIFQVKQAIHSDPVNGETVIAIGKELTEDVPLGTYYFDTQIIFFDGKVNTPIRGTYQIVFDVTDQNVKTA